jgi:hypothetical protein
VPGLAEKFLAVLEDFTAGDPMRERVIWTNLTLGEIAQRLAERGAPVSVTVVRQLLARHGYVRRKAQKRLSLAQHKDRDRQFRNIARLRAEYEASPNPIISVDTKKKELLGNFYRNGKLFTTEELRTLDHDFPSSAEGAIIPHGTYDVKRNQAHINLGCSRDSSRFACDSLDLWWGQHGRRDYPEATSLLLLCDGGGSNAANRNVFKAGLQGLADAWGIEVRVAHYPPYCSKHNLIEHRVFPHVTRACQGVVFRSVQVVMELMGRAHTKTGLRVTVDVIPTVYPAKEKAPADFKKTTRIVFDTLLPRWNYRAMPQAPSPAGAGANRSSSKARAHDSNPDSC